ncbi:CPBP family intramembrane glutamic endopeptidase [Lysobacter humi (ex Lee et al. 2017)]
MRSLSERIEFLLVVAIAFGYFIVGGLLSIAAAPTANLAVFTEAGLAWLVGFEIIVGALLAVGLAVRGWTAKDLGLDFTAGDVASAAIVGVGAWAASLVAAFSAHALAGATGPVFEPVTDGALGLTTIVAVSIVNPLFEEVFVCGYVIRALQRRHSIAFAVNVSVALRVSYHLYQGGTGAVSIIPVGLVFGWWFARTGRLWPVVIAHGLLDLVALASLAGSG